VRQLADDPVCNDSCSQRLPSRADTAAGRTVGSDPHGGYWQVDDTIVDATYT
jgi:hypothetical protein